MACAMLAMLCVWADSGRRVDVCEQAGSPAAGEAGLSEIGVGGSKIVGTRVQDAR